jgi:hypothetical protein
MTMCYSTFFRATVIAAAIATVPVPLRRCRVTPVWDALADRSSSDVHANTARSPPTTTSPPPSSPTRPPRLPSWHGRTLKTTTTCSTPTTAARRSGSGSMSGRRPRPFSPWASCCGSCGAIITTPTQAVAVPASSAPDVVPPSSPPPVAPAPPPEPTWGAPTPPPVAAAPPPEPTWGAPTSAPVQAAPQARDAAFIKAMQNLGITFDSQTRAPRCRTRNLQ